ncbi:hypothetical protein Cob_v010239 [Colletotrichum orbiculare MAFF 240422]|uniref:Uncharacterized protein n=1 Tax=Colletotrichum orbiculare (strain 104-T / ATCC 96160 / CBS 514.97 / LARS 414 / MAFF 240422) TaxID=1213857 RepID=A0A484FEH0_COLOR|nr:hypothetical protein Cob_v010239 [Colletotrichum orbiculare MAFF 240422]
METTVETPDPRESLKPSYWFGPEHYRGSVDAFFRGEVAKRIYHQRGVVSLNSGDVTSNIVLFGKDPRTLVMAGFCGCVGVIVVSQAAAWMAHLYESPVLKDEAAFQQGLRKLEFGAGHEQMKYGLGNLNRNVFAPDQRPFAVLFAPVVSTTGPVFQYREFMTRIDEMIERVLGIQAEWVGYSPKRDGDDIARFDLLCSTKQGKKHEENGNELWSSLSDGLRLALLIVSKMTSNLSKA